MSSQTSFIASSFIEGQVTTGAGSQDLCSGYQSTGDCEYGAPNEIAAAEIVLPACTTPSQTDCISSVELGTSDTTMQPATFVQQISGSTTTADSTYGLPAGSSAGLWQSDVPDAEGSTTVAAYLVIQYYFMAGRFVPQTFSAAIVPYSVENGSMYTPPFYKVSPTPNGGQVLGFSGDPYNCVWEGVGVCGVGDDFSAGTVASMQVRVPKTLTGWLFGRLQDPTVGVSAFDGSTNELTVSGTSVSVPGFETSSPYPDISTDFDEFINTSCVGGGTPFSGWAVFAGNFDCAAFDAVNDLRSDANNTATGVDDIWSFGSLGLPEGNTTCLENTSQIDGMVTTNAMVYNPNAPSFADGQFSYGVAGMHYLPGGSVAEGTYSFDVRNSIAQCAYGFANAPLSASVSITDSSTGEPNVATTTVSDSGGWLRVNAEGFNFSDPVIHVRLHGKVLKKARKRITCISDSSSARRSTITAAGRCPSGFHPKKIIG